jgi:hypothetical protein
VKFLVYLLRCSLILNPKFSRQVTIRVNVPVSKDSSLRVGMYRIREYPELDYVIVFKVLWQKKSSLGENIPCLNTVNGFSWPPARLLLSHLQSKVSSFERSKVLHANDSESERLLESRVGYPFIGTLRISGTLKLIMGSSGYFCSNMVRKSKVYREPVGISILSLSISP